MMLDKKLFGPLDLEEAEQIATLLGYSSLSALFEESGLGSRSKVTRIKNSGETDLSLRGLLRLLAQTKGILRDSDNSPIKFSEILGHTMLNVFILRDDFAAPTYRAGDVILIEPHTGSVPIDGEWIVHYQGRDIFGRLMVMPDGAWRFSRIGSGTEPIIFGAEHSDVISLVGRALYQINKIGA